MHLRHLSDDAERPSQTLAPRLEHESYDSYIKILRAPTSEEKLLQRIEESDHPLLFKITLFMIGGGEVKTKGSGVV